MSEWTGHVARLLEAAGEVPPSRVVAGHFPFWSQANLPSCHTDSPPGGTFPFVLSVPSPEMPFPTLTTPSPKVSPSAGSSCAPLQVFFSPPPDTPHSAPPQACTGPGTRDKPWSGELGDFTRGGRPAALTHSPLPPGQPPGAPGPSWPLRHPPCTSLSCDVSFRCLGALRLLRPSYKYVIMYAGVPRAPLLLQNLSWQTKVHWISHSGLKDLLLRVYLIT